MISHHLGTFRISISQPEGHLTMLKIEEWKREMEHWRMKNDGNCLHITCWLWWLRTSAESWLKSQPRQKVTSRDSDLFILFSRDPCLGVLTRTWPKTCIQTTPHQKLLTSPHIRHSWPTAEPNQLLRPSNYCASLPSERDWEHWL